MLSLPSRTKMFLCIPPVDMRKSFDGLLGIVQQEFQHKIVNGVARGGCPMNRILTGQSSAPPGAFSTFKVWVELCVYDGLSVHTLFFVKVFSKCYLK